MFPPTPETISYKIHFILYICRKAVFCIYRVGEKAISEMVLVTTGIHNGLMFKIALIPNYDFINV